MLNKIILIGRLVRDPEMRYTNNGTAVCNFTLAVDRGYKNNNGDTETDFIKIVTWRKQAETCAEHLGKGRLVAVDGRLQIRKSEGKDGKTYINPEAVANNVKFLDWGDSQSTENADNMEEEVEEEDEFEDIPF